MQALPPSADTEPAAGAAAEPRATREARTRAEKPWAGRPEKAYAHATTNGMSQEPSEDQAHESGDERRRKQPPDLDVMARRKKKHGRKRENKNLEGGRAGRARGKSVRLRAP